MDQKITHIAIMPTPGISHLIPSIEFAKRLALHPNFHITCFLLTTMEEHNSPLPPPKKAILDSLPNSIHTVFLSPVNFDDLSEDSVSEFKLTLTITRSLSSLKKELESHSFSAFIADPFGFEALELAKGLKIPSFVFFFTNAMALALFLYLPKLDSELPDSVRFMKDLPDPIRLPGCVPLSGKDMIEPLQDRESRIYKSFFEISKGLYLADGIIINSFWEMESEAMKALEANEKVPRVFSVGPIVQAGLSDVAESECLTWLDEKPRGSVLYVSFGSGGTLSSDQMNELALGLEMSGQNFLWVVRKPDNKSSNGAYLKESSDQSQKNDAFDFLPNGFLERTRERGLVVQSWVPQVQVLAHDSTGGFLTHCGWSSILESIVNGVPFIVWPLFAEQKMNAVMLVDGLHVALRPKKNENNIVGRDEISRVVKVVMEKSCEEGMEIGKCMNELKDNAIKALGEDGSSTKAFSELAFMLRNNSNSS
ncbi:hypothetical protein CsatB_015836 [Cannabis sativa]